MRIGRVVAWIAGALGAVAVGLAALVRAAVWVPGDVEPVAPVCAPEAPPAPRGQPLKVLVWNLQYAGSREHHFFYDGGRAVHVPPADVAATLDRIGEVLREADADLVLLQELDRDSARTGRVDQHDELLRRVPYPCHASTPYHRAAYVPYPSHAHLGRVDLHLSVFSRYAITAGRRTSLPLLDEPWWRRLFNLRRAVLDLEIPVAGGGVLRVLDTHLSAFSRGDGTLERQVAVLDEVATRSERAGEAWILGGDLNALPPGDDAARLGPDAVEYTEAVSPVKRLFDRWDTVVPAEVMIADGARWNTYVPFGAATPDRVIDYLFAGRRVTIGEARVLPVLDVSDHLPLLVTVTLP
jgi:endonuclease/exonuclease/phosphatase family metal-dependent hydrolase